jgi:hypothetical protein
VKSRTDAWSERNKKFGQYIQACDKLLATVSEVEGLIHELGSDPLNILDILRPIEENKVEQGAPEPPEPSISQELDEMAERHAENETQQQRWLREKKESISAPEWWESEPIPRSEPAGPPVAEPTEEPGETWQARKARERVDAKNQKNVNWIYHALMEGPLPSFEIKKRGEAAGISEYALNQARRSVDDIEISTVGYQGVRYWHLSGDKHKLPKDATVSKKFDTESAITDNEQRLLDLLQERGATTAELVGRTSWTPEKVKNTLQKLAMRKLIKHERNTLLWSRI